MLFLWLGHEDFRNTDKSKGFPKRKFPPEIANTKDLPEEIQKQLPEYLIKLVTSDE